MSSPYSKVSEIFQVACELPPEERGAYLDAACRGDDSLRAEVVELLSFDVDPVHLEPDAAPHETLPPGTLFSDRYRIVTWLGRGSMGVVYRAIDERLGQIVALKVLRTSSPARREQLVREVRLARRVTHPAVCRVHDFGESEHECFLTMEFVDGESLASLLIRAGSLAPDRVLAIARDLLGGIVAAHAEGVLHRDLKPANLLMNAAGRVRITDFGIALGGEDEFGMPAGTPAYMAPEQRAGGELSARTDLYSLAVVLYELLTGARPGTPVEPPSALVGAVDPRLERAIFAALESDPERRPASARVMLEMLDESATEAAPAAPASTAWVEQRRVTALFLERTDDSEHGEVVTPEEILSLLSTRRAMVGKILERHGGTIVQRLGRHALVLFGAPVARPDAPQRAVTAALEILGVHEEANRKEGVSPIHLAVQMGLHTGMSVVETNESGEVFVSGSTAEVSQALAARAAPDQILASEEVRKVAGEAADWKSQGKLQVAGGEAPLEIFEVTGHRSTARERASTGSFVGREEELAVLLDRWERVEAGQGQLVLIRGEAGIGKSRLVRALRERLADRGHHWVEGVCTPYTSNTPLYPHAQVIAQVCGIGPNAPLEDRVSRLREVMERYDVYEPELFEPYANLLALDRQHRSAAVNPAAAKAKTFRAIYALSKRYSEELPYVCVFEDLQWADPTTLEMLGRATGVRSEVRILMLCTARPELQIEWPTLEGVTEIDLGPLSDAEISEIAEGPAPLGERELRAIVERAEGNPFFAEELAGAASAELDASLPPSLRDSMMARLDALGDDRHLAQVASVIGRVFVPEILDAMSEGTDRRQLDEALHRFEARGLIVSHGLPPGSRYQFRHALLRDAAYESIPPRRRAGLHARAAQAISDHSPEWIERNPELLARHYVAAGLDNEAIEAWERAADRALESGANVEAASHLGEALEGVSHLPGSRGHDEMELHLLLKRGRALLATRVHGDAEVEMTFSRAHALCRSLRPTVITFRSLSEIWLHRTLLCDGRAVELAEELKQTAAASGDRHLEALAEASRASFFHFSARHRDALGAAARALALCDPSRRQADVSGLAADPVSLAHVTAGRCAWMLGDLARARSEAGLAETAMREMDHPFSSGMLQSLLAYLFIGLGDGARVLAMAEENIERSDRFGLAFFSATARGLRSQLRAQAGDAEGALADARAQIETMHAMGSMLSRGFAHVQLAGALAATGDLDAALEAADEGVRLSENPEDCALLSEAHRVRGVLLLRRDEATGRAELLRALEVARAQEAVSLELRVALALARSDGDEGLVRLRALVDRFGSSDDSADLREARRWATRGA